MQYSIYHDVYFFFLYAFIGWVFEEIYAAFKYGRFVNRGFINGPLCPKYGISMVIIINDNHDLAAHPVYQYILCIVVTGIIEYFAAICLHKIFGRKCSKNNKHLLSLNGYISLVAIFIIGSISAVLLWLVHPFLYILYTVIPIAMIKIVLIIALLSLLVDIIVTFSTSFQWKFKGNLYGNVAEILDRTKNSVGKEIFTLVQGRMYKAFPELIAQECRSGTGFGKTANRVFAKGLCVDKLIWMFLISALVGDWIETLFVWGTTGVFMSRSSLLYGTFSVVWGLGGAIGTAVLYPLREKSDSVIFLGGFLIGGVYEYSCSVFTEVVLKTSFWDYSRIPYNINGRVNLLYCFFWGLCGIAWIKLLYPAVSQLIEKISPVAGKAFTWLIIIFMSLNMVVSGLSIKRYVERNAGKQERHSVATFLDNVYPDQFIEQVYPNMKIK